MFSGMLAEAGPGVCLFGAPEAPGGDLAIVCLGITAESEGEQGGRANPSGRLPVTYPASYNVEKTGDVVRSVLLRAGGCVPN